MSANEVFKTEKWIEHEIQFRLQGEVQKWQASDIYKRLEDLDKKSDYRFRLFYGAVLTILIIPKLAHYMGWTL